MTREDAIREALRIQTARQCAEGRHVRGCEHRPLSPWVARAIENRLPASDRSGNIYTVKG